MLDSKIHFVEGSSYELNKEFNLDNYKLSVLITDQDIRATADEYANAARMSVLMCPNLPCLAEEYLDSDFQFGGEDQVRNSMLSNNLANLHASEGCSPSTNEFFHYLDTENVHTQ